MGSYSKKGVYTPYSEGGVLVYLTTWKHDRNFQAHLMYPCLGPDTEGRRNIETSKPCEFIGFSISWSTCFHMAFEHDDRKPYELIWF